MIDTHVHFWQLARGDYTWISDARPVLNRDFLPVDFEDVIQGTAVTECIAVQAAPTVAETDFLLGLAQGHDGIKGVVGWLDLTAPDVQRQLEQFTQRPLLKGIRPMAGVQSGDEWLAVPEYEAGFKALARRKLVLEALALPHHLRAIADIARSHPDLKIVINHAAKPKPADLVDWRAAIDSMAQLDNVYCKVSGFTQQSHELDHCVRVFDALLKAFGPSRLIWGSDFPVLLETADYRHWLQISEVLWSALSKGETAQIRRETARTLYRLSSNDAQQTA